MPVFASSVPGNFVVSIGVSVALMFSVSFLDGLPQASLITPTTNALAILGVLTLWAMTGMSKKPWHCFVAGSVATMALCGAPGGRPSPGSPVALAAGKLWSSPPPVIRYFDIRGRAEAIRLALADAGVAYDDASFTSDEWGKSRSDGLKAQWTESGKALFGQAPVVEVDGLDLVQSHSILRYLGRQHGWYTGSPAELALIDMAADGTEDIRKQVKGIEYDGSLSDEQKAAKFVAYLESSAPTWLGFYERMLARGPEGGYLSGSTKVSHADYLFFDLVSHEPTLTRVSPC
mmetsp:Transcript_48242/g.135002  ORF Transcript_48242/g.135002 Transcript_48242/m.135002 type:complete len:289 (-) Transcript_48242:1121-1987(-)